LEERLGESRGKDTKFFAFANTVAAKSVSGVGDGRGWVGIRYQIKPKGPIHDIVLHVKLKDSRNLLQQETLGIVGTNLIYAAYNNWKDPKQFITSLMDSLDSRRAEINFIRFTGPEFEEYDNPILNLYLVQNGFTDAVLFDQNGQIIEPSDMLYGKHVVILRGRYRPITNVHMDIIESGLKHALKENKNITKKDVIVLAELTLNNLTTSEKIDAGDFLARVETLAAQNIPVMISNFAEYYKLKIYFNKIKHNDVRILMGANMLKEVFNEKHYEELQGGILEGLGDIFKSNCKLLVYPFKDEKGTLDASTFKPEKNIAPIYEYFIQNKMIEDIEPVDKKCLDINTQTIVSEIAAKNKSWENKVPAPVIKIIKDQKLFGFK
jgi:nicotinic acid mononucleotide adenylyltransferase